MFARIGWLAIGSFSVGTNGFIIAGLLPGIAGDLGTTVGATGQIMTVFALTYAVCAPIFATLTGGLDRRKLLAGSLVGLAAGNLLASFSPSLPILLAAHAALALGAATYMPAANAVAVAVAPPERRGTAISIVTGGITLAVAVGAPLGSWIASLGGWRMIFVIMAAVSLVGAGGLLAGLPRNLPRNVASLAERSAVVRRPEILVALTVLWAAICGAFTVYTYLAPLLSEAAGRPIGGIGHVLLVFGIAAAVGNSIGGQAADRFGALRTQRICYVVMASVLLLISIAAYALPASTAVPSIVILIAIWGFFGWGSYPPHMARLVQFAPEQAGITLSLNASALYLGSASGAALGAVVLSAGRAADLGWIGALCTIAALGLLGVSARQARGLALAAQPAE
jgi:predicted MFS family arabinose efflux permease